MTINYSFIIPHKNCPDLLKRCLDSIPIRDDIQIIVIDDNSDESKKPSSIRNDVEILLLDKQQSNGAGKARNEGLKLATGKWLVFADADDFFSDNLPAILDKYADDQETDIVYLNACLFDEDENETEYITNKLICDYCNHKKYSEMNLRYSIWTPWSRMVKRRIVDSNGIQFEELPAGNDAMFSLLCSRFSETVKAEKAVVYKYYKPSVGSHTDRAREKMFHSKMDLRGRIITLQREVKYKYHSVFISEFLKEYRLHHFSLYEGYHEYRECLKKYDISLWRDIWHFLSRNFVKKIL